MSKPDNGHSQNDGNNGGARKHSKKNKKRMRGGRYRIIHVKKAGDEPREKMLKNGRIRKLDVINKKNDDALPRKTRDLLSRLAKMTGGAQNVGAKPGNDGSEVQSEKLRLSTRRKPQQNAGKSNAGVNRKDGRNDDKAGEHAREDRQKESESNQKSVAKNSASTPRFEGMRPGESFVQFNTRINREKREATFNAARKVNHQRMKKKAHYEKRAQRILRRKRRRRGELSDDDDDDDDDDEHNNKGNDINSRNFGNSDDEGDGLSSLPLYWQEIVQNNGRPISQKKRKRMERLEKAQDLQLQQRYERQSEQNESHNHQEVRFGEQVDRPPTFTVLPRKRGGQAAKG